MAKDFGAECAGRSRQEGCDSSNASSEVHDDDSQIKKMKGYLDFSAGEGKTRRGERGSSGVDVLEDGFRGRAEKHKLVCGGKMRS